MDQPQRFGVLVLQNSPWPDIVERVQRYEAAGFDAVWIADHFVSPWNRSGPWLEAWAVLAGLAGQTSRVRIGSLVSHPIYRNPVVLARQAMTVDQFSNGRLELGLGVGAWSADASMTGGTWGEPPERVARFGEAAALVDRLLRHEVASFTGQHYRVVDAWMNPGPVQRPRPRLTIAANGPEMVKLAARLGDVWSTEGAFRALCRRGATPAQVLRMARERGELLDEEAARVGRVPGSIVRSFLFGFGAAPEDPWTSVDAFYGAVGRFREIGFSEFVFLEPAATQTTVFERVVADALPSLTGSGAGRAG